MREQTWVDFLVVDVETANADRSSICQIGVASFNENGLSDSWKSLVNPEDYFDPFNISLHGIDEEAVQTSPTWHEVYPEIASRVAGNVVVSHTSFDRVAIQRACEEAQKPVVDCRWLDSARVVRRAWPLFSRSGYGLANVAKQLGIRYKPHDALEDARCAGEIVLRAICDSGLSIDQWFDRVHQPIHPLSGSATVPNPDGPLYGEVVVFTGTLSISRGQAACLAASAGCEVADGITKHTTILVVGNQDIRKLAGQEKSTKHRKAEALITKGVPIRILSESDFSKLVIDEVSSHRR